MNSVITLVLNVNNKCDLIHLPFTMRYDIDHIPANTFIMPEPDHKACRRKYFPFEKLFSNINYLLSIKRTTIFLERDRPSKFPSISQKMIFQFPQSYFSTLTLFVCPIGIISSFVFLIL